MHQEAVGILLTQAQFVQAVSLSSVLPGSDALQLAMYVGYRSAGMPGAMVALLGSILPPTAIMLGVVTVLHRLRREAWVGRFVSGLAPAVGMLMLYVASKLIGGELSAALDWRVLVIAGSTLTGFLLNTPPPIVLLAAGAAGVLLFR